jgi:hypothetical protein
MKLDLTGKKESCVFASAFESCEMVLKTKQRVRQQNYTAIGTGQTMYM